MNNIVELAVASIQKGQKGFCKFISANDVNKTNGHQTGFYISKTFCETIFEQKIIKGTDYTQFVRVKWQNDFFTDSRFKYYGSKNECHFTKFGKGFPFISADELGNLLVVSKQDKENYEAFILRSDIEFDDFFAALNITANDTNRPIDKVEVVSAEQNLLNCFEAFIKTVNSRFPTTYELSYNARNCFNACYNITEDKIKKAPDGSLLSWLDAEYQLFKAIEVEVYKDLIESPFKNIEELIVFANTILNRRKSRAGKSLEYHLATIFDTYSINYSAQCVTEGHKKPDFIFPNIEAYHSKSFNTDNLVFLASKTTCKDRWRQIINEADKIPTKHLFTLQQGISQNQLNEMYDSNIKLVVPAAYIRSFPKASIDKILTLESFVSYISSKQS